MNINPSSPVSISVVMCTYNGDKYLEQQIDSILCQTYPIHELIIQDDCSTDRTVTIIEAYQKRDPRVKLYINEAPLGFLSLIHICSRKELRFQFFCQVTF